MREWTNHGLMCAGLWLAWQGSDPAVAQQPRPIPLSISSGNPRVYPSATATPHAMPPATAAPIGKAPTAAGPSSMWADVLGLNSPSPSASQTQPSPPRSPSLSVSSNVRWEVLGRSVEGRVIEFAQFGDGPHQVLVVGALEGDKPEGSAMAEYLAAHLSRFPKRLTDVTITIVRDPNPDGRARRSAANYRGVLLDQNFNTPGWQRSKSTGPAAESEPETRALAELLIDVQPERVIILGTGGDTTRVAFAGPDEPLAKQVALEAGAQLEQRETLRQPGSLASYTGDDRGIPTIRLGLKPEASADKIWSDQKRAILTAVGCGSPLDFMPVVVKYGARKPRQTTGVAPAGSTIAYPSMPLVGAVPGSDNPAANAPPATLPYQDVRQGLPTVRIERVRKEGSQPSGIEPSAISGQQSVSLPIQAPPMVPIKAGPTPQVNLQPLPPVTREPPIPATSLQPPIALPGGNTPSRPIIAYPKTGF